MQLVRDMLSNHPLWGGLMLAVIAWYGTVTIYIAVRGAFDIESMLKHLKRRDQRPDDRPGADGE